MASRVSGEYKACRVKGFIPARYILASTVLKGNFNSWHISSIVNPVILLYIGMITQKINKCKLFPAFTIHLYSKNQKKIKNV